MERAPTHTEEPADELLSLVVAMVALPDLPPSSQDSTRASLAHSDLLPVYGVEDVKVEAEVVEESVNRMELPPGVFDSRHGDNTDVLLALLTQNKELEGRICSLPGIRTFWTLYR